MFGLSCVKQNSSEVNWRTHSASSCRSACCGEIPTRVLAFCHVTRVLVLAAAVEAERSEHCDQKPGYESASTHLHLYDSRWRSFHAAGLNTDPFDCSVSATLWGYEPRVLQGNTSLHWHYVLASAMTQNTRPVLLNLKLRTIS